MNMHIFHIFQTFSLIYIKHSSLEGSFNAQGNSVKQLNSLGAKFVTICWSGGNDHFNLTFAMSFISKNLMCLFFSDLFE